MSESERSVWRRWIAVAVFLASLGSWAAVRAEAADEITFDLGWIPYGMHAGLFLAKAKGYYQAEGITANLVRRYGGRSTMKKLAAGSTTFGLGSMGALIVARTKGAPVRAIGVYHDRGPEAIFTLEGSGIHKPKDLEGRSIGAPTFSSAKLLFSALAQANGIQEKKVTWKTMPPPAQVPSLLAGKVDAIVTYTNVRPNFEGTVVATGKRLVEIRYSDHGVDSYSNGIETADKTLKENPGLVRRFLKAITRGTAQAIKNRDEGIRGLVRYNNSLNPKIARKQWDITIEHMLTPDAKRLGLFHITPKKMARTRDILVEAIKLPKRLPVAELYTNEYLPKVFIKM